MLPVCLHLGEMGGISRLEGKYNFREGILFGKQTHCKEFKGTNVHAAL